MTREKWAVPKLTLLMRVRPSEAILAGCKASGEDGPGSLGEKCCAEPDGTGPHPCPICHGVDCS
jgi:hypothetical protein